MPYSQWHREGPMERNYSFLSRHTRFGSEGDAYNGNSNRKKKDNSYHSSLQVIQRFKITRVNKYALTKVKSPRFKHINSEDMGKTI